MKRGQRVIAFDKIGWKLAGENEDCKSDFFKPAIFLYINPHYSHLAVISWEDSGGSSHGHRLSDLEPITIN